MIFQMTYEEFDKRMMEIEELFKEVCTYKSNKNSGNNEQLCKVLFYKKVIDLRMNVRKEGVNKNE